MSKQVIGYILITIDKLAADGKPAKFGFFYCPELDQSIHFRFSALQGGYAAPALGDKVQAELKDSPRGPSAQRLRLLLPAVEVPQVELAIEIGHLARTFRCTVHEIETTLARLSYPLAPGNPALLAIPQVLAVRNMLESSVARRPKYTLSSAADLPIQFGLVTQYFADREYGFIQQKGFPDTYFKASATKAPVRVGESVFFRRKTRPESSQFYALDVYPISKSTELIRHNYRTFSQPLLGHALYGADQTLREEILTWQLGVIVQLEGQQLEEAGQAHLDQVQQHWPSETQLHLNRLLPRLGAEKTIEWWHKYAASCAIPDLAITALRQLAPHPSNEMRSVLERISSQAIIDNLAAIWPADAVHADLEATGGTNVSAFWGATINGKTLSIKHQAGKYFAELRELQLARVLHETYQYLLPMYDYIYTVGEQLDQASLLVLLASAPGDHVSTLAADLILDKVEVVDTGIIALVDTLANYLSSAEILEIRARVIQKATALQQVLIHLQNTAFSIDFTTLAEELTPQDYQQILVANGPSKDLIQQVRLWAAQHLLIHLQSAAVPSSQAIFRLLAVAKSKLDLPAFTILLEQAGEEGQTWWTLHDWIEDQGATPSFDILLAFLSLPEKASPFSQAKALNHLTEAELLTMLQLLVDREPRELMKISTPLLLAWIGRLPETEEQQRVLSRLVWTERQPLMLQLWLKGHSPYYDFARFRTLVFTLPAEQQFLFLRKTFKLIAQQQVKLTLADLNTIVRYNKADADNMGARLDYTVDLTLATLTMLQERLTLPRERDIMDFVARQVDEDIKQLPTFVEFFEECIKRSGTKEIRDATADKGKAYTEEFGWVEGSSDAKRVFIDGTTYGVSGGAFYKDGKRIRVLNWEVETGSKHIVDWAQLPAPTGVKCCEGRQAGKLDEDSQLPFWWCRGFPCFGANQVEGKQPDKWKTYVLRDFIAILGLPFDHDSYYVFIGVLNRVNQLLERLNCSSCQRILRPVGQSDFNLYRVNRFHCTHSECEDKQVLYLNTCLNGRCQTLIDSRVSKRCNYHDLGYDWQGPFICANCGGCCSKQMLELRAAAIAKVYPAEQLAVHKQYRLLQNQLAKKLYHADRQENFCYKCEGKMEEMGSNGDYLCRQCNTRYARHISFLAAYKKRMVQPAE